MSHTLICTHVTLVSIHCFVSQVRRYHEHIIAPALAAVSECELPTVAMIEGACVGGGLEIACNCDLRIAADDARFGVPINRLGFPMAPGTLLTAKAASPASYQ